ncbi:hypothetical protein ACFVSU_02660 [Microbacterium sp. NPDC058062]|uniref:hypothetical protein n=1 Tax=Microbacterium sp. NPDC058062 TaxID=3346320 RepID=UPI0036D8CF46
MVTRSPAPKPTEYAAMVSAWDQPEEFARLCAEYYREVAAERAAEARDITEPIHTKENE